VGLLDKALGLAEKVAPRWGLERARARAATEILNAGYGNHGASRTKKALAGWVTQAGGPDTDIVENLPLLRERCRDIVMDGGLGVGAVKTIRTNEIGLGLQLNATIDAKLLGLSTDEAQEWEDTVEREFALWAGTRMCDASRRCNFGELQALARLSQLVSGDVFALLPLVDRGERYDLRVHLLEADRVSNPYIVPEGADVLEGVEVGRYGEPLAYWVSDRHPADTPTRNIRMLRALSWTRIPAFGAETGRPLVLHLMESERPGQRRGVPILAPVIEQLKQLTRYSHAELMAAVVSGMFTAAITSERPNPFPGQVTAPNQQAVESAPPQTFQLGNGTLLGLLPGEKLEAVNPGRPNAGFEPFVRAVCQQIGAGVGIPYELLMMQFTSSYSASRGALLEAWKRFKVGRSWLAAGFCQPVYEQWLEEAVARGFVAAPGFFSDPLVRAAWCGAEWHGPTQGQLDPRAEVEAAATRVKEGFSTRTQETRELTGGDFWANEALRAREEAARLADGLVDAPAAAGNGTSGTATGTGVPSLVLTPSDVAAIAMVNEGRAANGLPPVGADVGTRWIVEHVAKVKADAAPNIAEAAAAEKGDKSAAAPAQTKENAA
jgi:lambda family phage portal protein